MGFHEIAITNSSTFNISSSVGFLTRPLVEFSKSRIGESTCERYLFFDIFLNRLSFEFLQFALFAFIIIIAVFIFLNFIA